MNWFETAKKLIGTKEIPGSKHNPEIIKMYADVGHSWVKDDETAWCAAFVGSVLKNSNLPYKKTLAARDYLSYGKKISQPQEGAIAVLWRGKRNSWQGHVGFVSKWTDKYIWLIGGNQGNTVSESRFPRSRVLGYRLPDIKKQNLKITKEVRKASTKLSFLQKLRNVGAFIFTSIAGIFSLDTLGTANDIVSGLKGFLETNMIPITLVSIVAFWFIMKWVEHKSVKDYKEGRYTPSMMEGDNNV